LEEQESILVATAARRKAELEEQESILVATAARRKAELEEQESILVATATRKKIEGTRARALRHLSPCRAKNNDVATSTKSSAPLNVR
ncbi:unnamed protein product, partial [Lampetra planeri]